MNSRHRDPCRALSNETPGKNTSTTPRATQLRSSANNTTPSRRSTKDAGPGLIVTRGLYSILEEETQSNKTPRKPRGSVRPQFLFCYLCGQQFSSASLPIHQPQCYVKKLIEWERMDPAKRGPKPINPEDQEARMKAVSSSPAAYPNIPDNDQVSAKRPTDGPKLAGYDLERFNEQQIELFNNNMLLKCDNCGRTFLPDRLEVHQRSCKPGKPVNRNWQRSSGQKVVPNTGRGEPARGVNDGRATRASPQQSVAHEHPVEEPQVTCEGPVAPFNQCVKDVSQCDDAASLSLNRAGGDEAEVSERIEETGAHSPSNGVVECQTVGSDVQKGTDMGQGSTPRASTSVTPECHHAHDSSKSSLEPSVCRTDKSSVGCNQGNAQTRSSDGEPSYARDSSLDHSDSVSTRPSKRIPLNNVSHFKNVQSRLKLNLKPVELPRCQYCNRTFNVDRLEKHESVCLERNKVPPRRGAAVDAKAGLPVTSRGVREQSSAMTPRTARAMGSLRSPAASSVAAPGHETSARACKPTGNAAAASGASLPSTLNSIPTIKARSGATSVVDANTSERVERTVKHRFCFQCGEKLSFTVQRFCAACGTKLTTDS
uniref:C2HC/C3H-type domain-containing protein n=1 Tax=Trypanosoma vivax (strain Y486) TaxID=1055687 RepID=G0U9I8_TRYVY|nr:conserved hypothetical protein, fragment [Trypanosoma vivax Y486]